MKINTNEPKLKEGLNHPEMGVPTEVPSSEAINNETQGSFTDEDMPDIDQDIMMYLISI
jgi:hypothetical protein